MIPHQLKDNQGMTALHFACLYGHLKIVQMLIRKNCDLIPKDKDGATPLHLACCGGNLDVRSLHLICIYMTSPTSC